ncbi:MAG: prepilin-type N-terminal cleavage/methylation domain-containing protein [Phycisphaerales bacterium]
MTRRAFTLIEAIIAMVVLSIAVPATLALIHDATVARRDDYVNPRSLAGQHAHRADPCRCRQRRSAARDGRPR